MTAPSTSRILLVDDEPTVRVPLGRALELEPYLVLQAGDGEEALAVLASQPVDALIVDVTMPRMDGLQLCSRLRALGDRTPILMLTARTEIDDRVAGLDAGADDYLAKPFSTRELKARLRALLRRVAPDEEDPVLEVADLRLDRSSREVWRGPRRVELAKTEFLLLETLMQRPGEVVSREEIFERVWGYDFGPESNSLAVYVGYLRRKTEAGGERRLLHTVRGVGYMIRPDGP